MGTFRTQKDELEQQIHNLKEQVEHLLVANPNFSLASELGELSMSDVEFKKLQDDLNKEKKDIEEKNKALDKSTSEKESLRKQLKAVKDSLMIVKQII